MLEPQWLTSVVGERLAIPDQERLVHLQLRRFAGCPVCNLHLRSLARRKAALDIAGIREIVVFHSRPEDLRKFVEDVPFALVADPDKRLYEAFGAEAGVRAMLDPRSWPTIARALLRATLGLFRGHPVPPIHPPGGRYGLPAEFLIDHDGRILACKYGQHVDDHWSADELIRLARVRSEQTGSHPRDSVRY